MSYYYPTAEGAAAQKREDEFWRKKEEMDLRAKEAERQQTWREDYNGNRYDPAASHSTPETTALKENGPADSALESVPLAKTALKMAMHIGITAGVVGLASVTFPAAVPYMMTALAAKGVYMGFKGLADAYQEKKQELMGGPSDEEINGASPSAFKVICAMATSPKAWLSLCMTALSTAAAWVGVEGIFEGLEASVPPVDVDSKQMAGQVPQGPDIEVTEIPPAETAVAYAGEGPPALEGYVPPEPTLLQNVRYTIENLAGDAYGSFNDAIAGLTDALSFDGGGVEASVNNLTNIEPQAAEVAAVPEGDVGPNARNQQHLEAAHAQMADIPKIVEPGELQIREAPAADMLGFETGSDAQEVTAEQEMTAEQRADLEKELNTLQANLQQPIEMPTDLGLEPVEHEALEVKKGGGVVNSAAGVAADAGELVYENVNIYDNGGGGVTAGLDVGGKNMGQDVWDYNKEVLNNTERGKEVTQVLRNAGINMTSGDVAGKATGEAAKGALWGLKKTGGLIAGVFK